MCCPCKGLTANSSKMMDTLELASPQCSVPAQHLHWPHGIQTKRIIPHFPFLTCLVSFSLSSHSLAPDQTHLLPKLTEVTLQLYSSHGCFSVALFSFHLKRSCFIFTVSWNVIHCCTELPLLLLLS